MGLVILHPSWGKTGPQKYFKNSGYIIIMDQERRDEREKIRASYFNTGNLDQNQFYPVIIIYSFLGVFVKSTNY